MTDKNLVKQIVEEWLEKNEYFLTQIDVTEDNRILVEIDHKDGVWIEDCVELSRYIEERLNRDEEDFELEVGSAGLGQPFLVHQQYVIHEGDEVEVLTKEGSRLIGTLEDVEADVFTLSYTVKEKREGDKRPKLYSENKTFNYDDVKETRLFIDFK
ncbi:MAG: ribosome assembly cofactor RimP [Alloprevotella sp.]|nr:ribosome assembly cofactor RimP [Alloprevotella sp.]